jgi:hypothetical protein
MLGGRLLRHVKYVRHKWFAGSCCPPNLARTLGLHRELRLPYERDALSPPVRRRELNATLNGRDVRLNVTTIPWSVR